MENYMLSGYIGSLIGVLTTVGLFIIKEIFENISCTNAIKAEIKCLSTMCEENFDSAILNEKPYLSLSYPLGTDYFTVFNNNSCKIGKIFSKKERELIISIYVTAKFFIDCLRTNNNCLDMFEKIDEKYDMNAKSSEEYKKEIEFVLKSLEYSKEKNILPAYQKLKHLLTLVKY